ncbi:MAG: AAA family ATPase [Firmicutes bacterium]|nr:AAA family ATPase [Bacillota bacterium]
MSTVLDAALAYLNAGFSLLPIRADGSKKPALSAWKELQQRHPTQRELQEWFHTEPVGLAVVAGSISGNLAVLDFDSEDAWYAFSDAIVEHHLAAITYPLPCAATPSGGRHLYFRTREPLPTTVLARDENGQTLIEIRGEGAYAIVPPSPAEVHPDGKPYVWIRHDLTSTPQLSAETVEDLLSLARCIDRKPESAPAPRLKVEGDAQRAGDVYNQQGDVLEILQRHGWRTAARKEHWVHLTRPGKPSGVSASWNEQERFLHVFTTNAPPFDAGRTYTPFAVFTLLEHAGDYSAAARALAEQYGLSGRNGHKEPIPPQPAPRRAISARELLAREFPPLRYLVPDILPEGGLTLLIGKGKIGKSWFCLLLACALSSGTYAFGLEQPLPKKRVLYCALEDGLRRLQSRIRLLGIDPDPDGFQIVTELSPLDRGGLDELRQLIRDTQAEVVVIDVLARILPQRKRGDDAYTHDYQTFSALKTLADSEGITIIGVVHARKGDGSDVVDTAQGTTGVTGAADSFLILRRGRAESTGTLYVGGRDVEREGELALTFSGGKWYIEGDAKEVEMSEARKQILALLRNSPEPLSPREIADELEKNYHTTRVLLRRMHASGAVHKDARGRYWLAKEQAKTDSSESRTQRTQRTQSTLDYTDYTEYADYADYTDYAQTHSAHNTQTTQSTQTTLSTPSTLSTVDYTDYAHTHSPHTTHNTQHNTSTERESYSRERSSGSKLFDAEEDDINWGG